MNTPNEPNLDLTNTPNKPQSVEDQVKAIIAEQVGVKTESIKEDSKFVEDLGADSLDIVELIMNIEETFSIDIPDDEAENILTVNDAVTYIKKHKSK